MATAPRFLTFPERSFFLFGRVFGGVVVSGVGWVAQFAVPVEAVFGASQSLQEAR